MTNLGWLYQEGEGVKQDYRQAKNWWEKAAALGQATAMNNLAWLYERCCCKH
jgi:TPR repeat protein